MIEIDEYIVYKMPPVWRLCKKFYWLMNESLKKLNIIFPCAKASSVIPKFIVFKRQGLPEQAELPFTANFDFN